MSEKIAFTGDLNFINSEIARSVVGGTDALFGHRGESIQTIVGRNLSGGFNFSYSFETMVVGVEEEPADLISSSKLLLYPNPASNNINLRLEDILVKGTYSVEILDALGRLVLQRELHADFNTLEWNLDVSSFTPGWYGMALRREGQFIGSKSFSKID